jgi:hypothetical protein
VLRGRAGQPHFGIHGGAVGTGGWEGYSQVALVPPIELVETRGGCVEGVGEVGRVIQRHENVG